MRQSILYRLTWLGIIFILFDASLKWQPKMIHHGKCVMDYHGVIEKKFSVVEDGQTVYKFIVSPFGETTKLCKDRIIKKASDLEYHTFSEGQHIVYKNADRSEFNVPCTTDHMRGAFIYITTYILAIIFLGRLMFNKNEKYIEATKLGISCCIIGAVIGIIAAAFMVIMIIHYHNPNVYALTGFPFAFGWGLFAGNLIPIIKSNKD